MSDTPSTPSSPSNNTPASSPVADAGNEVAAEVSPQQKLASAQTQKGMTSEQAEDLKEAVKKWKLKSQGRTREITDEGELLRLAQMGLGAHEKFEQAAKTRKQAEAILELIQKDPGRALNSLGMDVRKLAEEYLVAEAKKMQMTPEEKQKFELQQEIERLKSEKEEFQKQQREEQISRLQAQYEEDIQDQIITAIDKFKLPKNPKTVSRIAEYMANALENGYEATALDVATRVRQDLEEEHRSLYSHFDVEDLIKLLGDDQMKKIRQHDIKKVKATAPANPVKTEAVKQPDRSDEGKSKEKQKISDFFADLEKNIK